MMRRQHHIGADAGGIAPQQFALDHIAYIAGQQYRAVPALYPQHAAGFVAEIRKMPASDAGSGIPPLPIATTAPPRTASRPAPASLPGSTIRVSEATRSRKRNRPHDRYPHD